MIDHICAICSRQFRTEKKKSVTCSHKCRGVYARSFGARHDMLALFNTTTWTGLGLVVEEMERRGWWWRRKRSADRFYSGFFRFNVLYEDPEPDIPGESDAHAAAKAALLAIAAERAGRGEG